MPSRNLLSVKGWLGKKFGQPGLGVYSFLGTSSAIAMIGLVGLCLSEPMVFPSLGPTALLFFEQPQGLSASPRNTLFGHAIAIVAGWISLVIFGLVDAQSVLAIGLDLRRIGAAALSVGLTAFLKHLARAPHPPAGATTLIVSLGFLTTPLQLGAMASAIVLVTIEAWCINRLAGIPMPLWGSAGDS